MFSFDGECVYEDLRCLRNKTNMLEEKQIQISSYFFLPCKQETKYISNVTLWKNIKWAMLILYMIHARTEINVYPVKYFRNLRSTQAYLKPCDGFVTFHFFPLKWIQVLTTHYATNCVGLLWLHFLTTQISGCTAMTTVLNRQCHAST